MITLRQFSLAIFSAALSCRFSAVAQPTPPPQPRGGITIQHNDLCNLFPEGEPVTFEAKVKDIGAGAGVATAVVTDYFGAKKSFDIPVQTTAGASTPLPINLGKLDPGYYDLKVTLNWKSEAGEQKVLDSDVIVTRTIGEKKKFQDTDPTSFGVVRLVNRTADESRKMGLRFGIKAFMIGKPGVWWRPGVTYDLGKFMDATTKLGLPWTRYQFNQPATGEPGVLSTDDVLSKYPVLVMLKIEGFPESMFDTARYGSLEEWKKKYKKAWNKCTVPMKAPYQEWLKGELAKLPPEQNIFEIGNEVWSDMTGEEFAEYCQMVLEVVRAVRPDAKIGADPGQKPGFTEKFLAAGGMKGMDLVYIHPYSFTPLPEHRTRPQLRMWRNRLREATGKDFDFYVSEYGWPTAPQDSRGNSVSETLQAQRTARQSLMMYAEDVKAMIPHWLADREQDITERENWFGMFRLSGQPKPVLIAHAVCARMIDGSRFVGDLWLGPGVGALLFERDGVYTLALWTAEQEKKVDIEVGAPKVTVVDLMGRERQESTKNGKLRLALDGNVTYVVGVDAKLADRAIKADQPLNPELWTVRKNPFSIPRAKGMTIDGDLADWAGAAAVPLEKVRAKDDKTKAETYVSWNEEYLYAAVKVSGSDPAKPGVFTVCVGTDPAIQPSSAGFYDSIFTLTPDSKGGGKLTFDCKALLERPQEIAPGGDSSGVKWAVQNKGGEWTAEIAIPSKFLKRFPAKQGARIACRVAIDSSGLLLANSADLPSHVWPYATLK